jgi:hypothetical protein
MQLRVGAWAVLFAMAALSSAGCTERTSAPPLPDAMFLFDASPGDAHVDAGCRIDLDCADRFACTIDHCMAGVCSHVACTDCCGAGRACDPISGCGPTPEPCVTDADCHDTQPCTLDACRNHVCSHTPMDALCNPGQICIAAIGCTPRPPDHCATDADCATLGFCYGHWTCETEFGCVFSTPTDCDDMVSCTVDTCNTTTQTCAHDHSHCCMPGSCMTSCGSTGMMGCNPDGTAGMCTPPTEACNGRDDDCDMIVDEGCCMAHSCTTGCGSTGMTACNPDGTTGACMPPLETCNGRDDDCDTTVDEGFACVMGATSSCTTSCGSTGSTTCDATCHAGGTHGS